MDQPGGVAPQQPAPQQQQQAGGQTQGPPQLGMIQGQGGMVYGGGPMSQQPQAQYNPQQLSPGGAPSPGAYPPSAAAQMQQQHQLSYAHLQQQQQQQLSMFWTGQLSEIEAVTDFKNHQLPLARIKKIMKADEDVRMISAEAPVLFAKACEMFILELTLRSWIHTEENKRRTLQKNDIAAAITRTDIFDFLVDIVPRDELKEEGGVVGVGVGIPGLPRPGMAMPGPEPPGPYYYVPQQGPPPGMGSPVGPMMVGRPPPMQLDSMGYPAQRGPPMAYMPQQMWPQQLQPHQQSPHSPGGVPPN